MGIALQHARTRALWYGFAMSQERVNQLKTILEGDPRNAFARYALGMEYASSGESAAAVEEYRTLLEHEPNYVNAFFMGAQALQQAGRRDEAMDWLRRGIECARKAGNRHAESEMTAMLEEME